MMGEIVVGILLVAVVLCSLIYILRSGKESKAIPLAAPPRQEAWRAPTERPVYKAGKASQVKSSSGSRSQYPSGGSTTHQDTSSTDLLTTMLILDAIDDSSNYVEPSVDTYSAPSYSSPTSSSYSSSDDSCSRSSYSSYSSSDSSSSYSSSDSSSSSSSSSSCD